MSISGRVLSCRGIEDARAEHKQKRSRRKGQVGGNLVDESCESMALMALSSDTAAHLKKLLTISRMDETWRRQVSTAIRRQTWDVAHTSQLIMAVVLRRMRFMITVARPAMRVRE